MPYLYDFSKGKINISKPELIADIKNGLLVYKDDTFYSKKEADKLFQQLKKDVVYDKNSTVNIYGKTIKIPRIK